MAAHDLDLDFPACCTHCPYRHPVAGSCEHESRQVLIDELASGDTCPAYAEAKSEVMQELSTVLSESDYSLL